MDEIRRKIYKSIIGDKKVEIIEFLASNSDEEGFIEIKISEICQMLNVSKPTVIDTFKLLESKKIFERIKNGVYRLKF